MALLRKICRGLRRLSTDTRGQDLVEYTLMAGFVAVMAGVISPGIAASIITVFGKVQGALTASINAS